MKQARALLVILGLGCLASVAFMGAFGGAEGELQNAAPMWQPMALYAVLGAAHLGAAAWLGPGRPASWTWAVCTTMFGLFNCLFFPLALFTLYRLFRLKREVFAQPAADGG